MPVSTHTVILLLIVLFRLTLTHTILIIRFSVITSNAFLRMDIFRIYFLPKWTNPERHFPKINCQKDISWIGFHNFFFIFHDFFVFSWFLPLFKVFLSFIHGLGKVRLGFLFLVNLFEKYYLGNILSVIGLWDMFFRICPFW